MPFSWMLGHTRPIAFFRDRLVGAESQGQFDLMLRNAMIQFFNADVDAVEVDASVLHYLAIRETTTTSRLRCFLTLPTFFPSPPMSGSSSC